MSYLAGHGIKKMEMVLQNINKDGINQLINCKRIQEADICDSVIINYGNY